MNIIDFLKNGSGIHIKKKNKGKFTEYCGGKVTSECIAKGKRSPNPAIRKRATFADNARHFKHKSGGKAFVDGVSVLDSNPDAYKYVKKKYKMALEGTKFMLKVGNFFNSDTGKLITQGISNVLNTGIQNKKIDSYANQIKASNEENFSSVMNQLLKENQELNNQRYLLWVLDYLNGLILDLPSQIVASHLGYKNLSDDISFAKENLKRQNSQVDTLASSEKSNNLVNILSNLISFEPKTSKTPKNSLSLSSLNFDFKYT